MPNPYVPTTVAAKHKVNAPTLDLDPTTGPEQKQDLPAPDVKTSVEVPEGNIKEVLDWVGDDEDRAKAALEAEQAGDARKSLVRLLKEKIGK